MNKIRAAVVGYGNIGKYVVEALEAAPDFEIAGIVRRNGAENKPAELEPYAVVKDIKELKDVDVAILATPTRSVEKYAKEILAMGINTVDSFDIHTQITALRRSLDESAKAGNAVAIISAGCILQYVYNVPWEMKCHNGQTKSLLIDAGTGLLPTAVLNRKKSPYPKTYDPAYEKMLAERLYEMVHEVNSPLTGIVDSKKLDHFLTTPSDYGKPWYGQLMAGPQMLAYLLQVGYWIQTYSISL